MPPLEGAAIRVSYRDGLRVRKGRIVGGGGEEVYAATFIRGREMVLDGELRANGAEWRRIFVHELFHFAWVRLGNPARRAWGALLAGERRGRAAGELGWSAELRKKRLGNLDMDMRSRRAREYACEAFCDTAAWLYAGVTGHEEFTLAARWRKPRRRWFIQQFGDRAVPI